MLSSRIYTGELGTKVIECRPAKWISVGKAQDQITTAYAKRPRVSAEMKCTPFWCVQSLISNCFFNGTPQRTTAWTSMKFDKPDIHTPDLEHIPGNP